jgi:hypothetical protein
MRNPRRIALIIATAGVLGLVRGALAPVRDATTAPVANDLAARSRPIRAAQREAQVRAHPLPGRPRTSFGPAVLSSGSIPSAGTMANDAREMLPETRVRAVAAEPDRGTSSLPLPQLDRLAVSAGAVTASVTGWDPAAPRSLTLWRVEEGRSARLATTQSEQGGRFRFPEIAMGRREVVVTAGDARPQDSDTRLRLPDPLLVSPGAQPFP